MAMTVRELKQVVAALPDDMEVAVSYDGGIGYGEVVTAAAVDDELLLTI